MLMDVIGVSILYPVAPFIVGKYSHQALMVTLLSVIYGGAQFISAPVLGKLSDRFGRKPVLLVSLLGSIVGYVIFGIGGALWILFLSRLIDGITAGNMSTATAFIADISTPEARMKNFGLTNLAWGVGLVIGPACGGFLGQFGLMIPAYAAAVLTMVNFILTVFFLPESLPGPQRKSGLLRIKELNPFQSIGVMLGKPGIGNILIAYSIYNLAFYARCNIDSIFMIRKFAAEPWLIGFVLVLTGIFTIVVQTLLIPRFAVIGREIPITNICLGGLAICGLGLILVPYLWMFIVIMEFYVMATSLIYTIFGALAVNRVENTEIGQLIGVNAALTSLMSIFGAFWAGVAFDYLFPGAPYLIGSLIYIITLLIVNITEKKQITAIELNIQ